MREREATGGYWQGLLQGRTSRYGGAEEGVKLATLRRRRSTSVVGRKRQASGWSAAPHRDGTLETSVDGGETRGGRAPWTSVLGTPSSRDPSSGKRRGRHSSRDSLRAVPQFHTAGSRDVGLPDVLEDLWNAVTSLEEQESPREPRAEGRVKPAGCNGLNCGRRP